LGSRGRWALAAGRRVDSLCICAESRAGGEDALPTAGGTPALPLYNARLMTGVGGIQFQQMGETALGIFRRALAEASIGKAFSRHLHCERGMLRICEDLYDLQSY
jgi:hypothetical protein